MGSERIAQITGTVTIVPAPVVFANTIVSCQFEQRTAAPGRCRRLCRRTLLGH